MTEENTVQVAEQEVNNAATEAAVSHQERDYEAEAKAAGWVPEAEHKNPRRPYLNAKEFVERGEELLPFIRKENKELKERLSKTEADFAKRLERMERVNKSTFEAQQRHYETEIARLKEERESAVEAGDVEQFRAIDKKISTLKAPEPIVVEQTEPELPEVAFKKANPWFGEDPELTPEAIGFSQAYLAKYADEHGNYKPGHSLESNLKHTAEKIKAAFPEKFGGKKPAANGHAAVDGGGDFPGAAGKSDPLAKLPAEARARAKEDMKLYPKQYPNADAWVKVYNQ